MNKTQYIYTALYSLLTAPNNYVYEIVLNANESVDWIVGLLVDWLDRETHYIEMFRHV